MEQDSPFVTAIKHDSWWVRHYGPRRHSLLRKQAILKLGLTVRDAFNRSDDFETLLAALVDGLNPKDDQRF